MGCGVCVGGGGGGGEILKNFASFITGTGGGKVNTLFVTINSKKKKKVLFCFALNLVYNSFLSNEAFFSRDNTK